MSVTAVYEFDWREHYRATREVGRRIWSVRRHTAQISHGNRLGMVPGRLDPVPSPVADARRSLKIDERQTTSSYGIFVPSVRR